MAARADKSKSAAQLDGPRALRPEEHASALRLINSVLRPNGPPTISREYPLVLGKANLKNMRAVVKRREILSHAAIYFSKLRVGDLSFKVGGIGSVATHPSYRGQGLASDVIEDCIRIMRESGCHLSLLWTQRHDFYRRLGYETAGSEYLFQARTSDFGHVSCNCKVIPYSPEHLSAVVEIHERELLRTDRTRREYEVYLGIPKTKALLAVQGDRVSAYAVMGKGEDFRDCIHEWGGDAKDLLCLTRELVSSSGSGEAMVLVPAQKKEFTTLLQQMRLPAKFEYLAMMRVIDAEALCLVISDYLRGLLHTDFRISQSTTGVTIRIGEEEARINERKLVRVLFGPDPPSRLLRGFSRENLSILERFLPIPLFIWGLDSV